MTSAEAYDVGLARRAGGLLRTFNEAGVLSVADVHVAVRLGDLSGGCVDEPVLLAAALGVRGPRLGHVCVDLATIRTTVSTDADVPVDLQALPWPAGVEWLDRLRASSLVGDGRPLRLEGSALYLDRYWSHECLVAADLLARSERPAPEVDLDVLRHGLAALFTGDERPDLQRLAAASVVLRHFSVIAGGPGTGKTTTVARVLALLDAQALATGARPPLVALAAPTGKAAARLEEAVHGQAGDLPLPPGRLLAMRGVTLHRLLGWSPNRTRFRHHRLNRLAHDVVIVDETSMVPLSLMARLVEAVRPDARLILVGDPEQLASVEAGSVLGDVVGPAGRGLLMRGPSRRTLAAVTGEDVPAADPPVVAPVAGVTEPAPASGPSKLTSIGDGIVVLRRVHRFGGAIAEVAEAIQRGDADAVVGLLGSGVTGVRWIPADIAAEPESLGLVRGAATSAGRRVMDAARAGRSRDAIEALGSFRVLCAHRLGPGGAATWMAQIERWLRAEIDGFATSGPWYVGRPLMVTANDYSLRLYNGDTGVMVATDGGPALAAFLRAGEVVEVSPSRLTSIETVYAMTVHKAQGSQFDTVAVLLPAPDSPVLTRELLYTAITRARSEAIVAGTEESVRAAVGRPIARASGLGRRLWGI